MVISANLGWSDIHGIFQMENSLKWFFYSVCIIILCYYYFVSLNSYTLMPGPTKRKRNAPTI